MSSTRAFAEKFRTPQRRNSAVTASTSADAANLIKINRDLLHVPAVVTLVTRKVGA